jgi:crotonobetainyl-CoA:carnitine CoA-transferase CaiB-like acyl-CoA transferase
MLLKRYRVLDLTGPLGFLCGKILGDLGADVIKIEPPGGDPARNEPSAQSLFWLAYNANKRGITLDLESETGRQLLLRMAKTADFVVESFAPGTMENWGLGYGSLREENPGLILVSITPFGREGPYRDFQGSDLEIMALSGAMSLAGEKDGEPMRVTVPQTPGWVGAEAAMGALTALIYRHATGRGQRVDVSAQVAVMAALSHAPAFWDLNRENPRGAGEFLTGRSVRGAMMRAFWRCRDGWINFIIYGGAAGRQSNQQLVAWMDEKDLAPAWLKETDWKNFEVTTISQEEVDRIEAPIGRFFATLTKREFHAGAVKRGMLGYPVSTVEDIYRDPQLAARCFWQDVGDPVSGAHLKYPGGFAVIDGQRLPISRPAPTIGQHNREIFEEELGLSSIEIADARAAGVI